MTPLSSLLRDDLVGELREQTDAGAFVGIDFAMAMRFILADGVVPADELPVESLLRLEEWVRSAERERLSFTATELKNKTGLILERVVAGEAIRITRHGRTIAEIRPVAR